MPEMDGITLIHELRSNPHTNTLPIIMFTAKKEDDTEIEVLYAGADDYIRKPVDKDKLIARIDRLISRVSNLKRRFKK